MAAPHPSFARGADCGQTSVPLLLIPAPTNCGEAQRRSAAAKLSRLMLVYYRRRAGGIYGCRIGRGGRRARFLVFDDGDNGGVSAQQIGNSRGPTDVPSTLGTGKPTRANPLSDPCFPYFK